MRSLSKYSQNPTGLSNEELFAALGEAIADQKDSLKKVLLLPPDYTRFHSGAGKITNYYYNLLKDFCEVDIMPALGTHVAMTQEESPICR
jgi:nickel-dependent lactate racemase